MDCDDFLPFTPEDVGIDCSKVALKPGLEGDWVKGYTGDMDYCYKQ